MNNPFIIMTTTAETKSVSTTDFLARLFQGFTKTQNSGPEQLLVPASVRILRGNLPPPPKGQVKPSLHVKGFTFQGRVLLEDMREVINIDFENCQFLDGLMIQDCDAEFIRISNCRGLFISTFDCKTTSITIQKTQIGGALDLSGVSVCRDSIHPARMNLEEIRCGFFHIVCSRGNEFLKTPHVRTDDPEIAFQLHLAGIPVFMSSHGSKLLMQRLRGG